MASGVAALLLWPVGAHVAWLRSSWCVHGVPAFFAGLLVLVVGGALAKLVAGLLRNGPRWMVTGPAWRLMAGAAALAASVVVLFYTVELWRGKRAWAAVVELARRRGETLDPGTLRPAPVPGEQDCGRAPLFAPLAQSLTVRHGPAGNQLEPDLGPLTNALWWERPRWENQTRVKLAPWLEAKPTDLEPFLKAWFKQWGTNAPPPTDPRATAARLLEALAPLGAMVEELRTHSTRPQCRLPFDYAFPFFSPNASERVLLAFARIVRLRASAELALDQTEAAWADLRLGLRLADYLRQQPCLYYQEARAYAFADGLQPLWEGCVARRWTAAQLEALQGQLRDYQPLADYPQCVRLVAFANANFVESIIPTTAERAIWPGFHQEAQMSIRWTRRCYPVGWSLQDQAAIYAQWLARGGSWSAHPRAGSHGAETPWGRDLRRGSSDPFFPVFMVPKVAQMYGDAWEYPPFAQTVAHLATVACALERHRWSHEAYPETIETLAPGLLAEVPRDLFDGAPLRYERTPGPGFRLYSVGFNGQDEHGQPSPRRRNWKNEPEPDFRLGEGDWVWASAPVK